MNQPPLDQLLQKVDNKYSLVVMASKRARQIAEANTDIATDAQTEGKPVTVALFEIANGSEIENDKKENGDSQDEIKE